MTSYTTLEVQNFKGIREMKLEGLGMVNVFVGGNNVGKTSVLQAIAIGEKLPAFYEETKERYQKYIFDSEEEKYRKQLELPPLFNEGVLTNQIFGGLKFRFDTVFMEDKHFQITLNKSKTLLKRNFSQDSQMQVTIDGTKELHILLNEDRFIAHPKSFTNYVGTSTENHLNIAYSIFDELVQNSSVEQVIESLKSIETTLVDIGSFTSGGLYCRLSKYKKPIPFSVMGEGFVRLFALASIILKFKGQNIFIDEIENGFHWSVQKDMWRMILTAAKDDGTQFFFTTHSYEVLESLNAVLQEMKDNGDDLKVAPKDAEGNPNTTQEPLDLACVFRLKKDETDKVTARKLMGDDLEAFIINKVEIR